MKILTALLIVALAATPDVALAPEAPAITAVEAPAMDPGRAIPVDDQVNDAMVDAVIEAMDEIAAQEPSEIVLRFDTPGGYVSSGQRLARHIESMPVPVRCIVDGQAMSMGFYLLQSCTTRQMTKRSLLLAHEPSTGVRGNRFDMLRVAEELRIMSEAMAEHESLKLSISVEEFQEKTAGRDWTLGWKEAVDVGAVDSIIEVADLPGVNKLEIQQDFLSILLGGQAGDSFYY